MSRFAFEAPELHRDGHFERARFVFEGDAANGWRVWRNDEPCLELGPGYEAVQTVYCGVCSTDLARRFLPYPLPQIVGHEAVGQRGNAALVAEINASHRARGLDDAGCPYCAGGLDTHCPDRITFGINQLPGGFAPWFLAPTAALKPVPPGVGPRLAALTEPFAAALQGVRATRPRPGERAAVLGPRRLGALLLAALNGHRRQTGEAFEIAALARHDALLDLARDLGADTAVDLRTAGDLANRFDLVYDTTGAPEGLTLALSLARRAVHLKSTHGRPVLGQERLTELVVDELALIPFSPARLTFAWPEEAPRANRNVYVAPSVLESTVAAARAADPQRRFHRLSVEDAFALVAPRPNRPPLPGSPLPQFDLALAARPAEVDAIIRPRPEIECSLVRPRGAILLAEPPADAPLLRALVDQGLELHSSRCGDFDRALAILADNPELAAALEARMITHEYGLDRIETAFETAADSGKSVKVLVRPAAEAAPDQGA